MREIDEDVFRAARSSASTSAALERGTDEDDNRACRRRERAD